MGPPTYPPPGGVAGNPPPVQSTPSSYAAGNVPDNSTKKGSKNIVIFAAVGGLMLILFAFAWPNIRSYLGIGDSSVVSDSAPQTDNSDPVASGDGGQELTMANLIRYEHPSGLHSLDIPEDWSALDNSQPGEIVIQGWRHPQLNAYVILRVFAADAPWNQSELQVFSEEIVDELFGNLNGYQRENSEWLETQRSRVFWQAEDNNEIIVAATFVKQDGVNVSTLTVWLPQNAENFDELLTDIDQIVLSLEVDPQINIP